MQNNKMGLQNIQYDMAKFSMFVHKDQIPYYVSQYYFSKVVNLDYKKNLDEIRKLFAFLLSKEPKKLFKIEKNFDNVPEPCSFLFYDYFYINENNFLPKVWQLQSEEHRFDKFEHLINENDHWETDFEYSHISRKRSIRKSVSLW
ncbi:MAG: hypothetical protein EOM50_08775 [Erysipelotrichia bacterium]|nr:hypothetical protein [Erysipelotrichia bacterium]